MGREKSRVSARRESMNKEEEIWKLNEEIGTIVRKGIEEGFRREKKGKIISVLVRERKTRKWFEDRISERRD